MLTQAQKIRVRTIVFQTNQYLAKLKLGWFKPASQRQTKTYMFTEDGGPF